MHAPTRSWSLTLSRVTDCTYFEVVQERAWRQESKVGDPRYDPLTLSASLSLVKESPTIGNIGYNARLYDGSAFEHAEYPLL